MQCVILEWTQYCRRINGKKEIIRSTDQSEIWTQDYSIISMLSFLELISVLQLYKKMFLFFGNTLLSIWKQRDMIYAAYSQMIQGKNAQLKMGKENRGKECSYTQTIKHTQPKVSKRSICIKGIWVFFVLFLQLFSKFETISQKSKKKRSTSSCIQPSEFKMTDAVFLISHLSHTLSLLRSIIGSYLTTPFPPPK